MARVAAIIPHWGRVGTSEVAIRALVDSTRRPEIVVVVNNDQRSHPELVSAANRLGSGVSFDIEVVTLAQNLGYLGAAMRAVERLDATYGKFDLYWILNNDARPHTDALAALLECARVECASTEIAIVSCAVFDGGKRRPACTYRPWLGRFRDYAQDHGDQLGLEGVSGASFLLTATFLARIGQLPEHLFLYFEEVWLAWAARAAGMRVIACGASVVDHESGSALQVLKPAVLIREYLHTRARVVLTIEWRPECLLTVIPLTAYRAAGKAVHGEGSMALAIVAGLVDGVRLRLQRIDSLENATLGMGPTIRNFSQWSPLLRLTSSLGRRRHRRLRS